MTTILLISIGKLITIFSRVINLGHGSTWPGHIALSIDKDFIKKLLKGSKTKIILIAGTNGKTTTAKLIETILHKQGFKTFRNVSGANLLNGIASSMLLRSSILGTLNDDYAIFEVDENSLPLVLKELTPNYLLLLNLFRDQLDRYGEVNTIASKWSKAIRQLSNLPAGRQGRTALILNADDPQIAWLGLSSWSEAIGSNQKDSIGRSPKTPSLQNDNIKYFGLNDPKLALKTPQHAADSIHCPNCGTKLTYKTTYFSHLGDWECKNCKLKRPRLDNSTSPVYPLDGVYNRYNTNAAVLTAKLNNINDEIIERSLQNFKPAFGRQEKLTIDGKHVQLFLSKNPTSFNQSLRTINELHAKNLLIVLNDRIPDGRDVSWIWDVDFESIADLRGTISVSGDRVYDIALRLKYAGLNLSQTQIHAELARGIILALENTSKSETLYILPTYSAMLEVRKILTGKKIL